jgi:Tol biopolymer transport system component
MMRLARVDFNRAEACGRARLEANSSFPRLPGASVPLLASLAATSTLEGTAHPGWERGFDANPHGQPYSSMTEGPAVYRRDRLRRALILGLALTAVALATGALAPESVGVTAGVNPARRSDSPPARPLLTYVASNGGICLVRVDGSDPVRLTPRWKHIGSPAWSPRGRYVAFGRQTGEEQSKIFVADARGRVRWYFGLGRNDGGPLWAPDGRHIAYFAGWAHIFALAVARMNGLDDKGVATSPAFPTYGPGDPAWTADGQRLAFDDGNFFDTLQGIFTVALDGSDRQLLVADALSPAFSPDGKELAYVSFHYSQQHGVNEQGGIFVADADGTNPRLLAAQTGEWPKELDWSTPAWSADGTRLAFLRYTLLYGRAVQTDLVVVKADGSGERVLASGTPSAGLTPPVWSPGGKYLAFERYSTGAIVAARPDGGRQRVVVQRSGGGSPAWRPAVALPGAKRPPCPRR